MSDKQVLETISALDAQYDSYGKLKELSHEKIVALPCSNCKGKPYADPVKGCGVYIKCSNNCGKHSPYEFLCRSVVDALRQWNDAQNVRSLVRRTAEERGYKFVRDEEGVYHRIKVPKK